MCICLNVMKLSVICYFYQGTVTPAGQNFDPEDAAERLHKAMKGLGNSFSSTLTSIVIALIKYVLVTFGDKITELRRFEHVFISKMRKIEKGTTSISSHALRFEDVLATNNFGVSSRQGQRAFTFQGERSINTAIWNETHDERSLLPLLFQILNIALLMVLIRRFFFIVNLWQPKASFLFEYH